ncbi:MAG: hypothetical protein WA191_07015 [Telluria sp.]
MSAGDLKHTHQEVAAALDRLSRLFKPGVKLTFIARTPGNVEADMLVSEDNDFDQLAALIDRSRARSEVAQ